MSEPFPLLDLSTQHERQQLGVELAGHTHDGWLESPFRGCRLVADGVIGCRNYRRCRQLDDKNGGALAEKVALYRAYDTVESV